MPSNTASPRRRCSRSALMPSTEAARQGQGILIEARRDGDQVLLSVTDHGPGIPEADREHAVERFVRLEASRTQPGSGLGLSLASAVATLHGGELKLGDAQPGLRVTLAIPALAGQRQACGSNAGCATEGGMTSPAKGGRGPTTAGRAFRRRTAVCSRLPKPSSASADWLADLAPEQRDCAPANCRPVPASQSHPGRHRRSLALSVRSDARRCRAADPAARCDPERISPD